MIEIKLYTMKSFAKPPCWETKPEKEILSPTTYEMYLWTLFWRNPSSSLIYKYIDFYTVEPTCGHSSWVRSLHNIYGKFPTRKLYLFYSLIYENCYRIFFLLFTIIINYYRNLVWKHNNMWIVYDRAEVVPSWYDFSMTGQKSCQVGTISVWQGRSRA